MRCRDTRTTPARTFVFRTCLAVVLALCTALPVAASEEVRVGGYAFPPYVEMDGDGEPAGLTLALIERLNAIQDDFAFEFVLTSPGRRFRDFESGAFDLIFFESPEWGWRERGVATEATAVFLEDSEVYIARRADDRGQEYFDAPEEHHIAGMLGYHYGFADFEGDPAELEARFDITLVNSNEATIELVLRERADVGVVTRAYLARYLQENPVAAHELLISERRDQTYRHRILIRPGTAPDVETMEALIDRLEQEQELRSLWQEFGLAGSK